MDKLRILLVDDEVLLLESLEIILTLNNMQVVGMAHDGNEALELLASNECDLALVDLNMKGMGGIELISYVKTRYPLVKILVLTTFYDDGNITQAISNGADGYLLKDSGKEAILGAIAQIIGGQNVIDSKVMQRLAALMSSSQASQNFRESKNIQDSRTSGQLNNIQGCSPLLDDMTEREKEICSLLALGMTNRQIAGKLYISEGTVKNYISSIYDKTGIHDRTRLLVELTKAQ